MSEPSIRPFPSVRNGWIPDISRSSTGGGVSPLKRVGLNPYADRSRLVSDPKKRAERRKQHTAEIEASQDGLRKSIAETERLVGESDEMLRRHRKECEDDDA